MSIDLECMEAIDCVLNDAVCMVCELGGLDVSTIRLLLALFCR
jgi:hypothetical protein